MPRHQSIRSTGQIFVRNSVCFESSRSENRRKLRRQVFVNLEFQALVSNGNFTLPSRVSSAA